MRRSVGVQPHQPPTQGGMPNFFREGANPSGRMKIFDPVHNPLGVILALALADETV